MRLLKKLGKEDWFLLALLIGFFVGVTLGTWIGQKHENERLRKDCPIQFGTTKVRLQ